MFEKLYINKDNIVKSHLASHFKLSAKQNPFTDKEKKDMVRAPYSSTMESSMEIMVWLASSFQTHTNRRSNL